MINARGDDRFVKSADRLLDFPVTIEYDRDNLCDGALPAAGVDQLRALDDMEIPIPLEAGLPLQHRNEDLFGGAGVDRGFMNDGDTFLHVLSHHDRGTDHRRKIGDMSLVHRRG